MHNLKAEQSCCSNKWLNWFCSDDLFFFFVSNISNNYDNKLVSTVWGLGRW